MDEPAQSGEHRRSFTTGGSARARLFVGRLVTGALESVRGFPPGTWLHRRLQRQLEVTETDVVLRRGAPGLDGLRLVFLSDVHAGFYQTAEDLAALGRRVRDLAPDLVCLGGDLVATRPADIDLLGSLLEPLDPPLGIHAVLGNHECFYLDAGVEPFVRTLREAGVRLWINGGERLELAGASLWLAGIDDACTGTPDLERALAGARPDEPVLLLSHIPDYLRSLPRGAVDLVLAGHTHGGQVRLAGHAPITHSSHGYEMGLYEFEGTQLFVSRGVGVSALPIRIGVRSEVALLRLRR